MKAIRYILFLVLMGLAICFTACQTDGEYTPSMDRVTPVKAEFKYIADPDARFAVEYAGVELSDTLPYIFNNGLGTVRFDSKKTAYVSENSMSNLLRVYRLENDERIVDMEAQVDVSAVSTGFTIPSAQLAADSPVQILSVPEAATDSSSTAVQFFYGDPSQPEEVDITILAVDQYSLLMKSYNLNNVHDTMKAEVGEINLQRGELSERVVLNFYQFKNPSGQAAAKFYYRVYDGEGTLLQDYKAASSATNAAEIKPESAVRNKIPYATYKSAIMQFTYKDTSMQFASPTELLKGEKW
ncbi:MAG: hypothetical protein LBE71_00615 [Dysgonamonadaceae bacterium]|jgi:hypothetical protein|nr:hypothetical protein [Dysgonamonadaceae bacterium]